MKSGTSSILLTDPTSRKLCPAIRPNTPPAKLVVMDAVIASVKALVANIRPYHRRSGMNHRCLVTVFMGVTSRVKSRSISDPLPRTSASLASMAVPFRVRKAVITNAIGIIAGAPRTHRAIVCRLTYLPKSLTSSAIQVSAEVAPALAGAGAAGGKSLVVVLAIVQLLLQVSLPVPLPFLAFGVCRMPAQAVAAPAWLFTGWAPLLCGAP